MKHNEKKIEELIPNEKISLNRISMHKVEIKTLLKEYAEHLVQQERERIVNEIKKYRERVGIPNGFDERAGIIKGNLESSNYIINLINKEDE